MVPSRELFTRMDGLLNFKDDISGNGYSEFNPGGSIFAHSSDAADEDDSASDSRSSEEEKKEHQTRNGGNISGDKDEEEEMLLTDPLLHQKEKLEMKKLMDELIEEEKETGTTNKGSTSWSESAMSLPLKIPMKIGATLLKSVVIPYLVGEDSKREKREVFPRFAGGSRRKYAKSRNQEV
jgi:hypothetical protein